MVKDHRTGSSEGPLRGTPVGPYLRTQAVETEGRLTRIRLGVGIWAVVTGPYLAFAGHLPILVSPWLYSGVLAGFLAYAIVYAVWKPYRHRDLRVSARSAGLLDLGTALFIVLNNGGLESPYWGLGGAVLLFYIMRFGFDLVEAVGTVLVTSGAIALSQWLDPVPPGTLVNMSIGIGLTLLLIALSGRILVQRERQAVQEAFDAEVRAITRMVNTVQHEVNNPLAIASGNMELLKLRRLEGQEGPYLQRIEGALDRIQHAVGRLRELEEVPDVEGEGSLERYGGMRERAVGEDADEEEEGA